MPIPIELGFLLLVASGIYFRSVVWFVLGTFGVVATLVVVLALYRPVAWLAGSPEPTIACWLSERRGVDCDPPAPSGFQRFWVESYRPAAILWSGPDSHAVSFGTVPTWSYFLVVAPQRGPRLKVWNPLTKNYAWVDAAMVGPSGPPPAPAAP